MISMPFTRRTSLFCSCCSDDKESQKGSGFFVYSVGCILGIEKLTALSVMDYLSMKYS